MIVSLLAALLPTLVLLWLLWWLDRYEREPVGLFVAAFMWGAAPAIVLSLGAEWILGAPFGQEGLGNSLVQAAVIAPVVEESLKGLALLGLLRFSRYEIDGILDGVIYGALVGAGFAMTENFFYFLSAEAGSSLAALIFLRSFVFGLNHLLYTAITGAGVALSLRLATPSVRRIVLISSLILAMLFHAIHNFAVTLTASSPLLFLLSLASNWGGVLVMLLILAVTLQRERRIVQAYLDTAGASGLSALDRRRLTSFWPPRERFVPNLPWLDAEKQRDKRLYQYVAELALRQHRLLRLTGPRQTQVAQEIDALQHKIDAIAAARAQAAGNQNQNS